MFSELPNKKTASLASLEVAVQYTEQNPEK
jgi:hypothetical protein